MVTRGFLGLVALCITAAVSGIAGVQAATDPPVGTVWSLSRTLNPGTNGELNVTWSVKLDALTSTQITYRYTFLGEVGFITDQACNNPTAIPLPFSRLALTVTFSASGSPGQPSPLVQESLVSSFPDYQAPSFVNCWNLANPPGSYPNAVSYVRYQGLRFAITATVPRSEYFAAGLGHSVTLSVATNASPDGVTVVGHTIPVPSISAATNGATTTSVPKNTTTTSTSVAPGKGTTTTVADGDTTTTLDTADSTDTDDPTRNATFDPAVEAVGVSVDGVAVNLATETPQQEQTRKEHTADSLAITVVVLASSLAAVVPALGAVGAVGAVGAAGGVVGVVSSRGFGGSDLLPQKPRSELLSGRRRVIPRMRPKSLPDRNDIELRNPFDAPQNFSEGGEKSSAPTSDGAGRAFLRIVTSLQAASRLPALRPGLRRLAELSVVSPAAAVAVPLVAAGGSTAMAMLFAGGKVGFVAVIVGMFLLAFLAPVLSVMVAVGWFVGRVIMSPSEAYVALCESLALLPGLMLIPMMARSIIGPPERSRTWEWYASVVLTPIVAAYALKGWLFSLNAQVKTLVTLVPDSVGRARADLNMSVPSGTALTVGAIFALLVSAVAILAIVYSEESGMPLFMLERWIRHDDPLHRDRMVCIECTTLESPPPRKWLQPIAYAFAATAAALVLSPILGWKGYVLIVAFLAGAALSRRFSSRASVEVHPIVKKVPMVLLSIGMGSIAVSPDRAFVAFGVITVIVLATLRVRTRQLWP